MKILILQGPGMRLLGANLLANCDAATLEARLRREAASLGVELEIFQSNGEGALIDRLEARQGAFDRVLLFPTTLAQNGLALRQEMRLLDLPAIEVHFDPELARHSILQPLCFDQFTGLEGALAGLRKLVHVRLDGDGAPRSATARGATAGEEAAARPVKTLGRKKRPVAASAEASAAGTSSRPPKTLGRKR